MSGETLYIKRGRRYVPLAHSLYEMDRDMLKVGTFRLAYAYADGGRRYEYAIRPDTASFVAACMVARQAMEDAIAEKAKASPHPKSKRYSKKQLALISRFREDMAATGALVPDWWQHASSTDIAQAGIDAVRNWQEPK